jgi:Pro-kumamolisin, activation domain/Bacterial Ig-like domain (group 3)
MRPSPSFLLRVFLCLSFSLYIFVESVFAQQPAAAPRITQAVDDAHLTVLPGNTHPLALARYDRGIAPPSLPMDRMLLVLKRSPEQDAALLRLLDEQQDKSSPSYHKWLTPEQFGKEFGPADSDIQAVTSWLQTHGFQLGPVSKGRTVIEFSGTAAMVQDAFHTAIHKYVVAGESHWANSTDPQIPSSLAPVVTGLWTLHNFLKKPMLVMSSEHFPLNNLPGSAKPLATSSNGHHFLSPGDYAVLYGINPVYQAGINGTGVKIAVVGRSDISSGDINDFRSIFGLPSASFGIQSNGPDPGDLGGGEEAEAVLDSTWSGAVAPNANVQLVVSASTETTDGVDLSELYIVDNNLADVMTESFGVCEAHVTSAQLTGFSALAEQAAAQGITYLVSSGDTGSAGCDNLSETTATGPLAVNALASTQFNVAVGGTIFNENGHDSMYWNPSTAIPVTALKYIPENVWNESCTSTKCGNSANIAAGGGGASTVVPKPAWQSGQHLHIPTDGFRDVPDVSLTSAIHDPYLICLAGSCSQQGFLAGIGGTSASAPSVAGIMALVNQKMGGRVGLANYVLYRLADAEPLSQCNASNTSTPPAGACVFNDVTVGNNAVPGEAGFGTTSPQFPATVGYDLAAGLGSVQVNNLVNGWGSVVFRGSATTLALNPTSGIAHGSSVSVNINVTPQSGTGTPTGDVALQSTNHGPLSTSGVQQVDLLPLPAGSSSIVSTTHLLPGGTNMVTAHYAGDGTFASSDSTAVQVVVNPEPSVTSASVFSLNAQGHPISFPNGPYGSVVYLRADVAGQSGFGIPSGTVTFTDNGTVLGSQSFFLNSQGNAETPNGGPFLAPGSHSIGAIYSGDASFQFGASTNTANFTITKAATTTSVKSSASPVVTGSPVTLTATVNTTTVASAPSGTVLFFNGATQLPGNVALSPVFPQTSNAQSIATYQGAALPNGQNSITAQYTDDSNYTGSTSAAITVAVAPDFALAFTGTSGNVMNIAAPGGSGSLTITVTGQAGYNGTVNFPATACRGVPPGALCSFSPSTVTGSGMTTLTITTTRSSLVWGAATARNAWVATGGLTLAGVFLLGFAPRKRRWASLLGLLMLAWLLTVAGCGGGGGGGGTIGTIPGSYQATVTGADANFSHPITFTLNVQ